MDNDQVLGPAHEELHAVLHKLQRYQKVDEVLKGIGLRPDRVGSEAKSVLKKVLKALNAEFGVIQNGD